MPQEQCWHLEEIIAVLHYQVREKDRQLQAKDYQIQAKDKQIQTKDELIQDLDKQIRTKDKQLQAKDELIHVKDMQIEASDQLTHAKEQDLQALKQKVEAKDQQLRRLEQQIESSEETIKLRDREIDDLTEQIDIKNRKEPDRAQLKGGRFEISSMSWEDLSVPPDNFAATSAIIGDKAYFKSESLSFGESIWEFTLTSGRWNLFLHPLKHFSLVNIENELTTVGGCSQTELGISCYSNKLYSYIEGQWVEKYPPMPTKRCSCTAMYMHLLQNTSISSYRRR